MTRLRPQHLLLALLAAACGSGPPAVDMMPPVELPGGDVAHVVGTPITIQDAINMVRIESNYGYDDKFLVFSPDGSKFATVVWHGDLERNVNVYSLLVFDTEEALANPRQRPRPIISIPFEGDESDQAASAITQLAILGDNRTVTFVGRLPGKVPQVYAVDIETGRLRALTDHPTPVKAYAVSDDGVLRLYAAAAPDPVDTARVNRILRDGISGWSRAAYYTDYTVIHSRFPYAAATQIDGGTAEYNDRIRPFTDAELGRIRTPMLLEPHGLSLISAGAMANRLKAMGKPVDILYFKTAPHSTKQPRHRLSSLGTHLDWWRFWLQDYEDPAPEKRTQYMRWRELREQTAKIRRAGTV